MYPLLMLREYHGLSRSSNREEIPMARTFVLALAFFLVVPVAAPGATLTVGPSDCSDSAVNDAIEGANSGDTIKLTCKGTAHWSNTVTIPNTKGITLLGPGSDTPKTFAIFPLAIVLNNNQGSAIQINCENNMPLSRVTGLKFRGPASMYPYIEVLGRGFGAGAGAYRIDNCYFDTIGSEPVILLNGDTGALTGLVDDCTFHDCCYDNYDILVRETYLGSSSSCYGYDSWIRPFTFGSSQFHFIEDCLFESITQYNRHYVACDGAGGRYVVRHCTLHSQLAGTCPDYIDAHGDGTCGLGTGTRGGEIYGNTFLGTAGTVGRNIAIRGGQFLIYNNTFTTSGYLATPITMDEYRADVVGASESCTEVQYPSSCNPTIPQCVTPSDFSQWYPLPGQIRGTYLWNNLLRGINQSPTVVSNLYVSTYLQANRDFWVSKGKPAALAGYTPYPYPHPLRKANSTSSTTYLGRIP